MKEKKVIIIDDEAPARDIVRHYLKSHPDFIVADECADGFSGLKAIREINPDLIFLDIQMPRLTGFEMLEIMDENPVVIFTTAYDQYALKAFEMNAVDYLLKPISAERFSAALSKAREKLSMEKGAAEKQMPVMEKRPPDAPALSRVVVKKGSAINIIPIEDLKYIEAQDDYVMLYYEGGKALKQQRMKFYDEALPAKQFARIHRSYIVRITYIARLEPYGKENYVAILKGGERIPVSKSGYRLLKDELTF
ncbi:MAG: response regulator transcription factor [Bacteroidales bacterium]|nr:response regulator transcription factor [Bacteroidales bacterium]